MPSLHLLRRQIVILATLLLILAGLWLSGTFSPHISQATGPTGPVYTWGYNAFGQLGDGTATSRPTPQLVSLPGGATITALGGGQFFTLAMGSDGKLYAW